MGISGAGRRNERRKLLGASGKEEKVKSGLLGDHGFYLRQELFNLLGLSSACLAGLLNDPTFVSPNHTNLGNLQKEFLVIDFSR